MKGEQKEPRNGRRFRILLPGDEILVCENPLTNQRVNVWLRCFNDREPGWELIEEVLPRPDEIRC